MNLQFDSVQELEQFLMYAAHIGRAFQTAPAPVQVPAYDTPEGAAFMAAAQGDEVSITAAEVAAERDATNATMADAKAAVIKRKRRTKAEIEAERAAGEVPPANDDQAKEQIEAERAAAPAPQGNPFAVAPAMQAVLDAPNQGAATLAAMAATLNAETAPAVSNVHERALVILADPAQVESVAHLRACQGYIQKHGMAKYNESFKEGLNANIAAYQPEQRALHLAILESLDA